MSSSLAVTREQIQRELQYRLCESHGPGAGLAAFLRLVWPILEPQTPLDWNWHLDAMCVHLEAVTRGEIKHLIINVPPGFGKALDITTPVFTTHGWKAHGDLRPNDYVYGPDGYPHRVEAVAAPVWETSSTLTFDNGPSLVAGHGHLWDICRDLAETPRVRRPMTVATTELVSGSRPDCIQITQPLVFPPKRLVIDPYVLGAWLGDGASLGGVLYSGAQDASHFSQLGEVVRILPPGAGRQQAFWSIRIPGLSTKLRVLGLIGNKHIPADYLEASIEQRYALLQGLLDTDGNCSDNGAVAFYNKNLQIIEGVRQLVASLGMKPHLRSRYTMLNGKRFGPHYRVTFTPHTHPVFRLARKQAGVSGHAATRTRRVYLKTLEPTGDRFVNCIQVEGHRYLAGRDFIPTHNSILVTCAWPCFEWGPAHMAHTRWLFTSYAQILSIRDSLRRRLILASKLYKDGWGHEFTVGGRKYLADGAEQYTNTKMGFHLATSVGGSNTGQRGDRVVYDDPHNMNEIHSEIRRTGVLQWDDQVMSTRINDIRTSARVLVMQRGHEADLSGHLLKQGGWTHLCLPFEFRKTRACVTPYFRDPRTEEDEPIFPLRWPAEDVERQKRKLGSYAWSGQYQQDPSPEEGGILKTKWFRWYAPQGHEFLNGQYKDAMGRDVLPLPFSFDQKLDSWDMSFGAKSETASYCVGQAWGRTKSIAYLRRQVRDRWSFPDLQAKVRELQRWSRSEAIYVEDKANGPAILDTLRLDMPGLIGAGVEIDTVGRAHAMSPRLESGNFCIPHPELGGEFDWVPEFLHEHKVFPNGQNDDQIDTETQADRFLWLREEFTEQRFDNRDRGI